MAGRREFSGGPLRCDIRLVRSFLRAALLVKDKGVPADLDAITVWRRGDRCVGVERWDLYGESAGGAEGCS